MSECVVIVCAGWSCVHGEEKRSWQPINNLLSVLIGNLFATDWQPADNPLIDNPLIDNPLIDNPLIDNQSNRELMRFARYSCVRSDSEPDWRGHLFVRRWRPPAPRRICTVGWGVVATRASTSAATKRSTVTVRWCAIRWLSTVDSARARCATGGRGSAATSATSAPAAGAATTSWLRYAGTRSWSAASPRRRVASPTDRGRTGRLVERRARLSGLRRRRLVGRRGEIV